MSIEWLVIVLLSLTMLTLLDSQTYIKDFLNCVSLYLSNDCCKTLQTLYLPRSIPRLPRQRRGPLYPTTLSTKYPYNTGVNPCMRPKQMTSPRGIIAIPNSFAQGIYKTSNENLKTSNEWYQLKSTPQLPPGRLLRETSVRLQP